MSTKRTTTETTLDFELEIKKTTRRGSGGGTWVSGRVGRDLEYRFEALVFPEHAENSSYEIYGDSRIAKLWISRIANKETCYEWDRGLTSPATSKKAQAVVDFLTTGLAELIYDAGFEAPEPEPKATGATLDVANAIRTVTAKMQKALEDRVRTSKFDAHDFIDLMLAIADEIETNGAIANGMGS